MTATALLLGLVAVFLILNAGNFEQVLAGKYKIHLANITNPPDVATPPSAPDVP